MPTTKLRAAASVQRYRERMRREGLRLVQLWVPDTSAPGFAKEFRRQVSLVAVKERGQRAAEELATFLDVQDADGWTP